MGFLCNCVVVVSGFGGQANWGGNVYRFSEVFRFFGGEAEA